MRVKGWERTVVGTLACLLVCATALEAQGWVEPPILRGGFAVDKTRSDVRVRIDGRVAVVEVSEWFLNDGDRVAEGDYLYPLPGEAVFQGFSLFQGETELRGEIMDASRARQIYEDIVRRRADPALIELAGHGLLRARIFPIQPGEERKVTLRYTQVLERAGNALQLVYAGAVQSTDGPIGAESPEGRPLPEPVDWSFEIEIPNPSDFLEPFSPTHALDVDRDRRRMLVSVDEEVLGRFSVFLPLAGEDVGLALATHRPVGELGYFMLTMSPDRVSDAVAPRDITIVLDVSGSMSGDKIHQSKQALHQLLGSLDRDDRFRLISFSNAVRMHSVDWSDATGYELAQARAWVDDLVADGGTDIGAALDEAFRLGSPSERLPIVVFMTDGLPSVGERSPERLADRAERQADRARVFAFGVGHDVNTHLLDRLGEAGRGDTDYVQPGENVERVIGLLATKIRHPVLTDLSIFAGPTKLTDVYPKRLPDVFMGEELVLFGRFAENGQGQVTVQGTRGGTALEFTTEHMFPEASDANGYIPRLWAARKLGHLERLTWTEGETKELIEQITELALRYGLPSRFTSYLVQEPEGTVTVPGVVSRPILDPAISAIPVRQAATQSVGRADASRASGAGAVQRAEQARRARSASSLDKLKEMADEFEASLAEQGSDARALAGRIFTLTDGVWTDGGHTEDMTVVSIKTFSSAYFDLLAALPELGAVLRELDPVVIAGRVISLRIGDEGAEELGEAERTDLIGSFRDGGGTR